MKINTTVHRNGELIPLSKEDLEYLIYMTSDVWITPEVKRFKSLLLNGQEPEAGENPISL